MKNKFLLSIFCLCYFFPIQNTLAIDKCYGGGGLGQVKQSFYGAEFSDENTLINPRIKIASKSSIGLQLFVGCKIYENIDFEAGAIVSKKASTPNSYTNSKIVIEQRTFTLDTVIKSLAFDNGMYFYGKVGGGYFTSYLRETVKTTDNKTETFVDLQDTFGLHLALGTAYPLNDDIEIRAEYHKLPKWVDYYEATPLTINLTYKFD